MTFLRRLLSEIAELAGDDERMLGSVVLSSEDFLEMVKLDNGRLVTKLMALIQMVVTPAQMKRLLDGGGELVVLAPGRKEESALVAYSYLEQIQQFNLTLREVTSETSPAEQESILTTPELTADLEPTEIHTAGSAAEGVPA